MLPSDLPDIGVTPVAVDCETSGLHPDDGARVAVVSVAWGEAGEHTYAWPFDQGVRDKLGGIAIQQGLFDGDDESANLPESEWMALLEWLSQRRLVAHNAKFDACMLREGTRHWTGRDLIRCVVWDTAIAAKELDPNQRVGLEHVSQRAGLGDAKVDTARPLKAWLRSHRYPAGRYDLVPWSIVQPYAESDAKLTIGVYHHQLARLDMGEGDWATIQHELDVMRVLYQIERRGIGFDAAGCLDAADRIEQEMRRVRRALPFDPSDGGINAAKRYFFGPKNAGGLEMEPISTTDKGNVQLNAEVVETLVRRGVAVAAEYQRWRKMDTALSMWYRAYPEMIGEDGRLRTVFRQTKVVSGRFSVERVNLQAIPHDHRLSGIPDGVPSVRSFFHAAPGKRLWGLDLAQAELRVAARFARCARMLELIEQGADLHGDTARQLWPWLNVNHPDWFERRQLAKRGNFSLIFGVGPDKFRATLRKEGIDMSLGEVKEIVYKWRDIYPEFTWAIDRAQLKAERCGHVRLITGRRRHFAPYEDLHKAFNQAVQGSIAELVKMWMVEVEQQWPGIIVLQIHDALEVEVDQDDEDTPRQAARVGTDMATDMFRVPMEVQVEEWGG